ncbi:hypothetical protein GCM10027048_35050 [Hymenobacter coalescens]
MARPALVGPDAPGPAASGSVARARSPGPGLRTPTLRGVDDRFPTAVALSQTPPQIVAFAHCRPRLMLIYLAYTF